MSTTRTISAIAAEIRATWTDSKGNPNVNYAAEPYLQAMESLQDITDNFYCDSADSIVRYFLGNAMSFRGESARRIKAELKAMLTR